MQAVKDTALALDLQSIEHNKDLKEEDYSIRYLTDLGIRVLKYVELSDTICYLEWLAVRGIYKDKIVRLREKYPVFSYYMNLCDSILESRYKTIPFHKHTLHMHCKFLLANGIGGQWKGEGGAMVHIHNGNIFESLEASPIVQVKEDMALSNAVEEIDVKEKVYLMEPESKEGVPTAREMDVSECSESKDVPSNNFFSAKKSLLLSQEDSKKDLTVIAKKKRRKRKKPFVITEKRKAHYAKMKKFLEEKYATKRQQKREAEEAATHRNNIPDPEASAGSA